MKISKLQLSIIFFVALIFTASCTRENGSSTGRGFAYEWYVAKTGDDSNTCQSFSEPCLTIMGAVNKTLAEDTSLHSTYDDIVTIDHTIHVAAGTYRDPGPYDWSQTVEITNNITILGAGSDLTFIDGRGEVTALYIRGNAVATIEDVTIQNGGGTVPGSGLSLRGDASLTLRDSVVRDSGRWGIEAMYSTGTLTLINVIITNNSETGLSNGMRTNVEGGQIIDNGHYGIDSYGDLTMTDTIIARNNYGGLTLRGEANLTGLTITNNGVGGRLGHQVGLFMEAGNVSISDSTFLFHPKDGILTFDGGANLTIANSLIQGNTGVGVNIHGGTVTLTQVTIRDNGSLYASTSVGGGIDITEGTLHLENSLIAGNHNGGINIWPDGAMLMDFTTIDENLNNFPGVFNHPGGEVTINNSTISNNSYMGIDNRGTMLVTNSTISNNSNHGIMVNEGQLTLSYVTIAENGINGLNTFYGAEGVRSVENVLIAYNGNEDCEISSATSILPVPAGGTNLDTDGTCTFAGLHVTDAGIGPLAVNPGGPPETTATHALLLGSPAIDTATGACPSADQRTVSRPFGSGCDIGAFEFDPTVTAVSTSSETDFSCGGLQGVGILENGLMRTTVNVPGIEGLFDATLNDDKITCQSYEEYPDLLLCDSPKPPGNTYATLIIFDDFGIEFCNQTFTVPAPNLVPKACKPPSNGCGDVQLGNYWNKNDCECKKCPGNQSYDPQSKTCY